MTALEFTKKIKENLNRAEKYTDPEIDLFSKQVEEMEKEAEILDRQQKNEKVLDPVTGQPVNIYPPSYLGRNIVLRREMKEYLTKNAGLKGTPDYDAVSDAYEMLLGKCNEDEKTFESRIFDGASYTEKKDYEQREKQAKNNTLLTSELTDSIMKQAYIMSLKKEYEEASAQMIGNKEEAKKWKEEIVNELYSDDLDKRVERFAKEDPVGKMLKEQLQKNERYSVRKDRIMLAFFNISMSLPSEYHKIKIDGLVNDKDPKETKKQLRLVVEKMDRFKMLGDAFGVNTELLDTKELKYSEKLYGKYNDAYDRLMEEVQERSEEKEPYQKRKEDEKKDREKQEERKKEVDRLNKEISKAEEDKKSATEKKNQVMETIGSYVRGMVDAVDPKFINEEKNKLKDLENAIKEAEGRVRSFSYKRDMLQGAIQREEEKEAERVKKEEQKRQEREKKISEKTNKKILTPEEEKLQIGTLRKIEKKNLKNGKTEVVFESVPYSKIALERKLNLIRLCSLGKITKDEFMETANAEDENVKWDLKNEHPIAPKRRNRSAEEPVHNQIIEEVKEEVKEPVKEEAGIDIQMSDDPLEQVKKLMPKDEPEPQKENARPKLQPVSRLLKRLRDADQNVWNGSGEYEVMCVAMDEVATQKRKFEQNKNSMSGVELRASQSTLLHQERYTAELMKHYLNRKDAEKKKAEEKGDTERANSKMRRETVENVLHQLRSHIRETEEKLGIPRVRDKAFESVETKLRYARQLSLRVPELKDLSSLAGGLRHATESSISIKDKLSKERQLINEMQSFLSKYHGKVSGRKGYNFSLDNGKDGKPIEPEKPFEKTYQAVLLAYVELSNTLLNDISVHKPEDLEKAKKTFRTNNRIFKVNINTGIKPAIEKCRSYEDVMRLHEQQRAQLKQEIYRREFESKKENTFIYGKHSNELDNAKVFALGVNDSVRVEDDYKYNPDYRDYRLLNTVYDTMYAEIAKGKNVPFDVQEYQDGCKGFRDMMSANTAFSNNLKRVVLSDFDLSDKLLQEISSRDWKSIDVSVDKVRYAKDIAFGTTLYGELSGLNKELKSKNPDMDKVSRSLKNLKDLKDISHMLSTERIYDQRIPGNKAPIALKDVEKELRKKAEKVLQNGMQKDASIRTAPKV